MQDLQQAERGGNSHTQQRAERGSSVTQQLDKQTVRQDSRSSMQSVELHHQAEGRSIVEVIQAEMEKAGEGGNELSIQAELEQVERDSKQNNNK